MSIKIKVLLILFAVIAAYGVADLMFHRFVIYQSFLELEEEEAREDMERVVQAFSREVAYINSLCHDWAAWDDTYEFILDVSEEYISDNLVLASFVDNRLNLFYYIDLQGNVVWSQIRDLETLEHMDVPEFAQDEFAGGHPLIRFEPGRKDLGKLSNSGIFSTSQGPILISARPVLTSNNEGPIRGTLIMGRFLGENTIEMLQEQTRVKFNVVPVKNLLSPESRIKVSQASRFKHEIKEKTDHELTIRSYLEDILGNPALAIYATIPRKISQRGATALSYASLSIIITGVIVLIVMLLLLQRMVIGPLTRFKKTATSIADSQELSARVSMSRKDEIGELGRAFDRMVERLSKTLVRLRESEQMHRAITEHSLAHITLVQDGRFIYANPSALENIGYSREELKDKPVLEVVHPEDREMVKRKMMIREKEKTSDHYQLRYITKSGDTRRLEILAVPIPYKGSKATLGNAIDITYRKEARERQRHLEAQLQRAQKMEAMGTMAGGVAHDLNNILGGIVSYPDLLLMNLPEDSPLRRPLLTIRQAGQRASELVQDLLTMARRGVSVKDFVSLNNIASQYLQSPEFARLELNKPVSVNVHFDEQLFWVKGSSVHLYKTLMNLVQNSVEAMGNGGSLSISTENIYLDKPHRGFEQIKQGEYVVLTVADTGIGIALGDLEKIFEPFYTKKVMGMSGTGLGMAVVWATMKDHQGYIDIISNPGDGTTFRLYFPATRETPNQKTAVVDPRNYHGRGEKILVVDDDREQRQIAVEMFTVLGYNVTTVESGEKAVDFLKKNSADLILLDMIMNPGMDGLDSYKEILKYHPKQKAIIVSGYAETERIREIQRLGAEKFIKKPYRLEKLALAIKDELNKVV